MHHALTLSAGILLLLSVTTVVLGVETKPVPAPVLPPITRHQLWPTWWNEDKEKKLLDEVVVGIVTTKMFHPRLKFQMESWWSEERRSIAEVYSDVPTDPDVPNLIYTHCDSSYHFGLWCKNTHMMKLWASPRYKNIKWFIRANDDSYYHLENIYDYVSTLHHNEPVVIGDMYCYAPNYSYPVGGCGFIFSRAVIDQMDWDAWNKPLTTNLKLSDYWEDVQWGQYLNDTFTRLIAHPGITNGVFAKDSELLNLYLQWQGKPWPFPYRPLASHQARTAHFLPELHRILHSLDYVPQAEVTFNIPPCRCHHGYHSRCQWTQIPFKKLDRDCRWSNILLRCLGPGPFTAEAHAALVEASKKD